MGRGALLAPYAQHQRALTLTLQAPGYRETVSVESSPAQTADRTRVGPYRLLARIGEGGMGVVHLAQAPDGRRVALKVLRPHVVGDSEARERLAREVSSLRRVTSARVAEILDADPHGPTPYVVTRYVPGLSLYHHVAEEGLIEGRDLRHFADGLAEALQGVHAVGVLHRDVKPTNVLMEGRSPVLIDFGLARVAEDPRLTQTGFLLGTPGYLAPEILYGDDATPASDVHAWAATVAFAATGRPPYGRGPAMAVMDRVRRGEHDLSEVPPSLADVLSECLNPEPLERLTLPEVRAWLGEHREPRGPQPDPARELWTMPVHPAATPEPESENTPRTQVAPLHAPAATPSTTPTSVPPPREPATRVVPREVPPTPRPRRDTSALQQIVQVLALGVLAAAMVAYAPYAGAALVGLVVLAMRTFSVTRERHARRRMLRGRSRWYDVPRTTLTVPAYLVIALAGSIGLVLMAVLTGLALFSVGYVLGQTTETNLVLAGLGFASALWWCPGSRRVRETTHRLVGRTASTDFGGWFVVVACLLGAAVLLGLLFETGANWAPAVSAPWNGIV